MDTQTIVKEFDKRAQSVVNAPTRSMKDRQLTKLGVVYNFLKRCDFDMALIDPMYEKYGI